MNSCTRQCEIEQWVVCDGRLRCVPPQAPLLAFARFFPCIFWWSEGAREQSSTKMLFASRFPVRPPRPQDLSQVSRPQGLPLCVVSRRLWLRQGGKLRFSESAGSSYPSRCSSFRVSPRYGRRPVVAPPVNPPQESGWFC